MTRCPHKRPKAWLWTAFVGFALSACQTVKPYQRAYLNDAEMQLGARPEQRFEQGVQSYREGSLGGQNGKAAGGCGCN